MDYIKHIRLYQPKHYQFYLKKCKGVIGNQKEINEWAKNLSLNNNLMWIKVMKNLINNEKRFFEESCIATTTIIVLFMLELDIDIDEIELTNKEINNLLNRFENIVRLEYAIKKGVIDRNDYKHTLLKDAEKIKK